MIERMRIYVDLQGEDIDVVVVGDGKKSAEETRLLWELVATKRELVEFYRAVREGRGETFHGGTREHE